MQTDTINEVMSLAKESPTKEICGAIIIFKGREKVMPCVNLSDSDGSDHFLMDYSAVEDMGEVVALYHSHPFTNPQPSQPDLVGVERTSLPWLIVNPNTEQHTITEPSGYVAPLIGRKFVHGVLDCYALVKDYYAQTLNIELPEIFRQDDWWHKGQQLYRDNFESAGFSEIDIKNIKLHDCFIICNGTTEPNHAAVYVGDGKIMHHVQGRLSSIDVYGGFWLKNTWKVVRHRSQV